MLPIKIKRCILQNRWRNIKIARDKRLAEIESQVKSGAQRRSLTEYKFEDSMQFLRNIDLNTKKSISNVRDYDSTNFNEEQLEGEKKDDDEVEAEGIGADDYIKAPPNSEKSCKFHR